MAVGDINRVKITALPEDPTSDSRPRLLTLCSDDGLGFLALSQFSPHRAAEELEDFELDLKSIFSEVFGPGYRIQLSFQFEKASFAVPNASGMLDLFKEDS